MGLCEELIKVEWTIERCSRILSFGCFGFLLQINIIVTSVRGDKGGYNTRERLAS